MNKKNKVLSDRSLGVSSQAHGRRECYGVIVRHWAQLDAGHIHTPGGPAGGSAGMRPGIAFGTQFIRYLT